MHGHFVVFVLALGVVLSGCMESCKPLRPKPGRDASLPCPDGSVAVCFGRCAPAHGRGEECTVDECAPGAVVCNNGLACVPDPDHPERGRCELPDFWCDPDRPAGSPGNRCAPPMFCARLSRDGRVCGRSVWTGRQWAKGVCRIPQHDGERCDSDWEAARASNGAVVIQSPSGIDTWQYPVLCLPCAPGLRCWNGHCRRPCGSLPDGGTLDGGTPDGGIMDAAMTDALDDDAGPVLGEPNLGVCPPDPPGWEYLYVCERNNWARESSQDGGANETESALLCTTCASLGQRCPAPTGQSQPVERRETRRVTAGGVSIEYTIEDGPEGTSLCCDRIARCVDGRCCVPPGSRCTQNEQCCAPRGVGGVCCGDLRNRNNGLIEALCSNQRGFCITCGGATGVPCPPGSSCTSTADCERGYCIAGRCVPCGWIGDRCCQQGPACNPGAVCVNQTQTCERCGNENDLCCEGGRCNADNLVCNPNTNRCVRCGRELGRCCAGNRCDPGLACINGYCTRCQRHQDCPEGQMCRDGRCVPCGERWQWCCPGDRCNRSNDRCEGPSRVCRPWCGVSQAQCCNEGQHGFLCEENLVCYPEWRPPIQGSTCQPCGRVEGYCCEGGRCGDGLVCRGGRCKRCGQLEGDPCCADNRCLHSSLICDTTAPTGPVCRHCGNVGEPCCTTSPACNGRAVCSGGRCEACGGEYQQCCLTDPPCDPGYFCHPKYGSCRTRL